MTREIKFRVWNNTTKKMIYFWLFDSTLSETFEKDFDWYTKNNVMQFTWLKDKNWVEIYEWDVVARNHMWIWRMTKHIVKRESVDTWWWYISVEYVWYQDVSFWEVIWNIYENKDLLTDN